MTDDITERFPTARSAPTGRRHSRNEVLMRRAGVAVLAVIVLLGLFGYLGPSSRTVSEAGAAGTVAMKYDAITRPGADTEVEVTLRPEQPSGVLALTLDQEVLKTYGIDLFTPEPLEQRAEGSKVVLEFAAEGGEAVVVRISGRTPTTQPPGRTPWRLQWITDGSQAAALEATTWVMP